jgi:hypothetical protein
MGVPVIPSLTLKMFTEDITVWNRMERRLEQKVNANCSFAAETLTLKGYRHLHGQMSHTIIINIIRKYLTFEEDLLINE